MAFSYSIYQPSGSPLHKLNPTTKLVVTFTIMIGVVVTGSPTSISSLYLLLCLLGATGILIVISRVTLRTIRPFLISATFLGIFFSLSWIVFTNSGHKVADIFGWRPTNLGLLAALNSGIRVYVMVLVSALLLYVMSETEFLQALRRLKVPYVMSFTLMLALRLLPAIVEDLQTIRQAQMTRGFELQKGAVLGRFTRGMRGLIPLIAITFRRIDTLSRALESRAFSARARHRTAFHTDEFRLRDVLILGLCAVFYVAIIVRWAGAF